MQINLGELEDFVRREFAPSCGCDGDVKIRPYTMQIEMPAGVDQADVRALDTKIAGLDFVYYRVVSSAPQHHVLIGVASAELASNEPTLLDGSFGSSRDLYPTVLRADHQLVVKATLQGAQATKWYIYLIGVAVNG